jgi:hypothetical protein
MSNTNSPDAYHQALVMDVDAFLIFTDVDER